MKKECPLYAMLAVLFPEIYNPNHIFCRDGFFTEQPKKYQDHNLLHFLYQFLYTILLNHLEKLLDKNDEAYCSILEAHEITYPYLAVIAHNFLAISGTSVLVKRIFSGDTDLIMKRYSSLQGEHACMYLKNWINHPMN
ncbi:hypothetical protein C1645_730961 [Glomus cerebriforme]|uniref:HAT C-terminal dimerisation domain-containing protein n=1 Tax=Glomus cerebriforme TaxID=658196 RepID=A0A397TN00_9GLOM|nr:hypothetical protein C1645_730961 [Glomus cerebriforme]